MKSYPIITLEIVGYCNAKCPYCFTHNNPGLKRGAIKPDVFEQVIKKLLEYGIYGDNSTVFLYNWGEPFLHPHFSELISILNKYKIRYGLSTNASELPNFDNIDFHYLQSIMVSMPGFSQKSYDRIHGFNFEHIKSNIITLNTMLKQHGYLNNLVLTYHIYQFNLDEIFDCNVFANSIGAAFSPYYAGMNDWWQRERYVNNQMSTEELKRTSNDLFLSKFEESIKNAPRDGCSMHWRYFVIDEFANVTQCCNMPTNHDEYNCGNLLTDDIETIIQKKNGSNVCTECISSGFAVGNDLVIFPKFYTNMYNKIVSISSLSQSLENRIQSYEIIFELKDMDLYENAQKQSASIVSKIENKVVTIQAIAEWVNAHSVNPIKIYNLLAVEAANSFYKNSALILLNKAIELEPTNPGTLYNAGIVFSKFGMYKDAYFFLDKIAHKDEAVQTLITEIANKIK